jgi:fructoselysine-6-P-deglycase FrlB-like protein
VTSHTEAEIATQPECWARAAELAPTHAGALPARGERVAVVGCGTSWFVAQAYAALRERAGQGETDAFTASELPTGRRYDRVLALTRSGTTSEVTAVLAAVSQSTVVTAVPDSPAAGLAAQVVALQFADEQSVVQTRFPTTLLALLRAHLGEDLARPIEQAGWALQAPLPEPAEQRTFLGQGWAYGVAQEAALKLREAAGAWTEAYPAMEYRHGPIRVTQPGRAVWVFGTAPPGLVEDARRTGGTVVDDDLDPLADLIRVPRLAVALAQAQGEDPDRPRHLTRSVILAPR